MFDKVKAIFEEQLGVSQDEMKLETNFKDDLGVDSLDLYEIVMKLEDEFETNVDLPVDAFIPATYIRSEAQKLDIYKRIAAITTREELVDMQDELTDRFGDIPKTAINLMRVAFIKSNAHLADIIEIKGSQAQIIIRMYPQARVDVNRIPDFVKKYDGRVQFKVEAVPYFRYTPARDELKTTDRYLTTVTELVEGIGALRLGTEGSDPGVPKA